MSKRNPRPHTTADWRCYIDGCRLPECREAWREYGANRNKQIAYGRVKTAHYVDSAPARARVAELKEQGIGQHAIAEGTGLHKTTLARVMRRDRIWSTTADAILGFTPRVADLKARVKIDGTGTRRRLRALNAIGWTNTQLALRLGCSAENVRGIVAAYDSLNGHVTAGTARKVAALYDELWDQAPPAPDAYHRAENEKCKRRAAARGWAPPLAWDDATIDDPTAEPDFGTPTGRPGGQVGDFDTLDDLANMGCTLAEAAERVGLQRDSITQTARRHGGPWVALLRRFDNNAISRGIHEPAGKAAA